MTMSIAAFPDGGRIPVQFSQAAEGVAPGEGTSPAIAWTDPPAGTQSFVLNMHDLDVARNGTSDDQPHWIVWNLPAAKRSLPQGVPKGSPMPDGSSQVSLTGPMYRGPGAAAAGPLHHYVFELYALDTTLDVKPTSDAFETRARVIAAMQGHILAKAVYGGLFKRPQ
jgi:Raf kinase inhibitor-like YbhB/YbcL family protein